MRKFVRDLLGNAERGETHQVRSQPMQVLDQIVVFPRSFPQLIGIVGSKRNRIRPSRNAMHLGSNLSTSIYQRQVNRALAMGSQLARFEVVDIAAVDGNIFLIYEVAQLAG
jgi:hypothetical protein